MVTCLYTGVVASAQVRSGLNLPGQIRNVIPQMIRPGTPPTNRSVSPAISIGTAQTSDAHRYLMFAKC